MSSSEKLTPCKPTSLVSGEAATHVQKTAEPRGWGLAVPAAPAFPTPGGPLHGMGQLTECLRGMQVLVDRSGSQNPAPQARLPHPHELPPTSNAHTGSPLGCPEQVERGSLTSSNHSSGRTTGLIFPVCL